MLKIGKKEIGKGKPTFITFEAGPTHDGLESAKRLVKHAAAAGGDAVKFQIFDADKLVQDKSQNFTYQVLKNRDTNELETISEPLYKILKRRCLDTHEWMELKDYCDSLGLAFFSTVGFEQDIELLKKMKCDSIKIASADINHIPLIRKSAETGMCIQLDTGMSTVAEIEIAVDVIRETGNENIIIHHCPSGYPARLESINLNVVRTLGEIFDYPIAFSDHTPGKDMDIIAVALGVNMVEKTITEDRMTRSVEHVMSLEPDEMQNFVSSIRDVEVALGNGKRSMSEEEKTKRNAVRRSLFFAAPGNRGQKLSDCEVEFRRPGYGIPPDRYEELLQAKLSRDCPKGHMLTLNDLSWSDK